ncbi:potassium channel family protein [Nitrincola iocasae]|uniref:TrkA family potassium uptake protein n=1 Tax=Nitrincola iocasae TaxID=2614693 RepID=A0A5J6LDE1_9GAMM|nr:TrkA family potassium uptake protein [Nitrincola iocasae]QEW06386.1 TrkA family potassium uptake protein [Nitrincola iocasae]
MKRNRIAVIGLGRFGHSLAIEAQKNGIEVLAIDRHESLVNDIADQVSEAMIADCTNPKAITAVDWQQFSTVVVAIGSDIKNSMMAVIHLQEAGVQNLWCKVQDRYHAALVSRMGVQRVISPEEEMGRRAGRTLKYPDILQQMQLTENQYVAEIKIINIVEQRSFLSTLRLQDLTLLAIKQKKHSQFESSRELPDRFHPGDKVLVMSRTREGFAWPSLL